MIKIAIIDDEQKCIEDVKKLLLKKMPVSNFRIYEYTSCDSFSEALNDKQFDIIFLDIILDKKDGIELGRLINDKQPMANIIFISSNPDYYKDVYKVRHSYFLTKNIEKERFEDAVSKAIASLEKQYIVIHEKKEHYRICLTDVMYFESRLKHTRIYMCDGSIKEFNVNLNDIESKLQCRNFLRVHKSFLVNLNHLKKYNRQDLFYDFDKVVPISRAYINTVKEKITLYLGETI